MVEFNSKVLELAEHSSKPNAQFIEEIDIGAFKQKSDLGLAVRKSIYSLLSEMYDQVKMIINVNTLLTIVTNNGLMFEIEESGLLPCFILLGKIVDASPVVCVNNIDAISTALDKVFTKWIATVGKSDRAVNIVRATLRVCYKLNTCQELVDAPNNSF